MLPRMHPLLARSPEIALLDPAAMLAFQILWQRGGDRSFSARPGGDALDVAIVDVRLRGQLLGLGVRAWLEPLVRGPLAQAGLCRVEVDGERIASLTVFPPSAERESLLRAARAADLAALSPEEREARRREAWRSRKARQRGRAAPPGGSPLEARDIPPGTPPSERVTPPGDSPRDMQLPMAPPGGSSKNEEENEKNGEESSSFSSFSGESSQKRPTEAAREAPPPPLVSRTPPVTPPERDTPPGGVGAVDAAGRWGRTVEGLGWGEVAGILGGVAPGVLNFRSTDDAKQRVMAWLHDEGVTRDQLRVLGELLARRRVNMPPPQGQPLDVTVLVPRGGDRTRLASWFGSVDEEMRRRRAQPELGLPANAQHGSGAAARASPTRPTPAAPPVRAEDLRAGLTFGTRSA